jgi:hypothetical protein
MLVGALCVVAGVGVGYAAWHKDTVTPADLREAGMRSATEVERYIQARLHRVPGYDSGTTVGNNADVECALLE